MVMKPAIHKGSFISPPSDPVNLSNLSPESNILLFTPVLIPAGATNPTKSKAPKHEPKEKANDESRAKANDDSREKADDESKKKVHDDQALDPFEPFGLALSTHHERVRHVPYLPQNGYTETHATFLSKADVIVIVVCEPKAGGKEEWSLSRQMDFEEAVREDLEEMETGVEMDLVLVLLLGGMAGGAECHILRPLKGETASKHVFPAHGGSDRDGAEELAQWVLGVEGLEKKEWYDRDVTLRWVGGRRPSN